MKHRIRWENKNFDDMDTLNRKESFRIFSSWFITNNIYVKFKHRINHCSHRYNLSSCEIKTRFTLNGIFSDS